MATLRGGRRVGLLERLLIIVLVGANTEVAIVTVIAARGIIRFPEVPQDSTGEEAEGSLIGLVSS